MLPLSKPCDCDSQLEVSRADDVRGATERMCTGCGIFFPTLQRGETWEPWANETAPAYIERVQGYLARSSPPALG